MLASHTRRAVSLAMACDEIYTALVALNPARLAAPRDPLDISLPALSDARSFNRDTLQLISALYWQSEIEHTGLVLAAEMLADARYELSQLPAASMARLDALGRLFGDNAPDFGRYLSRAQSGRQVINALALLPQLEARTRFSVSTLPCQDAYVWLDASGLATVPRAAS